MEDYCVFFMKDNDQEGACAIKTIGAKDHLSLKSKIKEIITKGNYTAYYCTKKDNMVDVDTLSNVRLGKENYESYLKLKDTYEAFAN